MENVGFSAGIVIGIAEHVGYAAAPAVQTMVLGLILFSLSSWFAGRGLLAPFFAVWAVIAIGFAQVWKIVLVALVALDIIFWAAFLTSYGLSTTIRYCASRSYHGAVRKPAVKKYQEAEAAYHSVYHNGTEGADHHDDDDSNIDDVLSRQDQLIAERDAHRRNNLSAKAYDRPIIAERGDTHHSNLRRTPRRYETNQLRSATSQGRTQRHRDTRHVAPSDYSRYEGDYDSAADGVDDDSGSISKASQEPKTARNIVSQLLQTLKRNDILP